MREAPTTKMAAIKWQLLILGMSLVVIQGAYGQPAIPKFESFQPINLKTGSSPTTQSFQFQQVNPMLPNDAYREQNYRMMQQAGMNIPGSTNSRQASMADVKAVVSEEKAAEADEINEKRLGAFQNNVNQFLQ